MIVTHKLSIDLVKWEIAPVIDIMQDDKYSRNLEISLLENGRAFSPPDDCTVMVRYKKADRIGGAYDTLPDGTPAGQVSGNVVTVALAPQVCTTGGAVDLVITLLSGTSELTSFVLQLYVHKLPTGVKPSREYINMTGFIPQPSSASVGQYLEVKSVNSGGRITALQSVDAPSASELPENVVVCDTTDSTEDESTIPVNADTLGGKLPEAYALSDEMGGIFYASDWESDVNIPSDGTVTDVAAVTVPPGVYIISAELHCSGSYEYMYIRSAGVICATQSKLANAVLCSWIIDCPDGGDLSVACRAWSATTASGALYACSLRQYPITNNEEVDE